MNYCMLYSKTTGFSHYKDKEVTELKINYNSSDPTIAQFLKEWQDKTIVIVLEEEIKTHSFEEIINTFAQLKKDFTNFKIMIPPRLPLQIKVDAAKMCKEAEIPFFFGDFINSWDLLKGIISLGVTDVYITEHLCFDMVQVSNFAKQNNVKIRIYPNICQSTWLEKCDVTSFYIRPDDVIFYEPYVDIFEFMGDNNIKNTAYEVYECDKKWFAPLKSFILGLEDDIDGRAVLPNFAEKRLQCQKKCSRDESSCGSCYRHSYISSMLVKNHITYNPNPIHINKKRTETMQKILKDMKEKDNSKD